jgi:hypothetical protein
VITLTAWERADQRIENEVVPAMVFENRDFKIILALVTTMTILITLSTRVIVGRVGLWIRTPIHPAVHRSVKVGIELHALGHGAPHCLG